MLEHILKSKSSVTSHCSFCATPSYCKPQHWARQQPSCLAQLSILVFINKEVLDCRKAPLHNQFTMLIKKKRKKEILFLTAEAYG